MADSKESIPGTGGEDPAAIEAKKTNILALKTKLARARHFAAGAEAAYGERYKTLILELEDVRGQWERANTLVIAEHERTKKALEVADAALRGELIDFRIATGEKTFDEHLSVRDTVKLEYEIAAATDWAKKEAPFMLIVAKTQFEKYAKDKKVNLDFVKKETDHTAVIASVLPVPAGEPIEETSEQGAVESEAV